MTDKHTQPLDPTVTAGESDLVCFGTTATYALAPIMPDIAGLIERWRIILSVLDSPDAGVSAETLSGWGRQAATALEALQAENEHRMHVANGALKLLSARADAAEAVNGKLWDALLWIDRFDPETIAAAEDKFGLDVARALLKEPTP